MMSLLGTDIVFFVHGSEGDAYRAAGANVESHAIVGSMAQIRNAILDRFLSDADAVVMCDDDLQYVKAKTHEKCYRITDREDILAVIGNGVMIALDSGCGLFGWSRHANPLKYAPHDPFSVAAPVAGCFVCTKNTPRADENLTTFEDLDMTLSAMKMQRFVLIDCRFWFCFGRCWKGSGRNQGLRTGKSENLDRAYIRAKWGPYVDIGKSRLATRKKNSVTGMSIRVNRRSNLSSTK
jgi:hypothetical protein